MKTKILLFSLWLILFGSLNVFATDLAWFVLTVNPSTVKIGEPTDLTVKAINDNWDVITDYQWDIIITITDAEWNELDMNDYIAPNDWTYEFTEEDQWIKIFTKWLIINKAGDFKVKVEDFETSKAWSVDVKVVSSTSNITKWTVDIMTPQNWETITTSEMSVAWTAKNYKNSKIQVLIDWKVVSEWLIDTSGNFQLNVSSINNWEHTLKVNVLDLDNKVISSSNELTFKVKIANKWFQKIELLPSSKVDQSTKLTVNVTVGTNVSSAVLHVANYWDYPMDRISTTKFTTQFIANTPGKFDISLTVNIDWTKKEYKNISQLLVLEKMSIWNVTFNRDNHKWLIDLNWKFTWQIPSFKIQWWVEKWIYTNYKVVNENKFTISNINESNTYFIKIIPVDKNGNQIADPSKEIVVEPNMKKSATCVVDNIKVNIIRKKWANYLVWDKAEWVINYLILKWDTENNLIQIASITWTEYKLPYDPDAKKVKYAYFAVKAVCDDWTTKQIDKAKKVKVWPFDWLIYAFILAIIVYWLRMIYRID